jgi:hypothetical protein
MSFRTSCLCGSRLQLAFSYNCTDPDFISSSSIEYQFAASESYIHDEINQTIIFPLKMNLFDGKQRHEINFNIHVNYRDDSCELISEKESNSVFIRQYLTLDMQRDMNLYLTRRCSNNANCNKETKIKSMPIMCNFYLKKVHSSLENEKFCIKSTNKKSTYIIHNDMKCKTVFISYREGAGPFGTKYESNILVLPFDKFMKYEYDEQFIRKKIETLLLFI